MIRRPRITSVPPQAEVAKQGLPHYLRGDQAVAVFHESVAQKLFGSMP
jgi:hypothetical protein